MWDMWAEAWTLPELGSFAMKRAIPGVIKVRDVHSGIGRGEVAIPADWPQIDAILAATEGSLIRVLKRGSDGGRNVVFEFTPEGATKEYTEDNEAVWRFTGPSIEAKLDQAIVLPYDYPTNPSVDPDWVYGFTNLLSDQNSGFEDNPYSLVNADAELGSTFGWPTTGDRWDQIAPESFEAKTGAGADTGDWYFEVTADAGEGVYQNFNPPIIDSATLTALGSSSLTYTVTARLYVATGDTVRMEVTPASSVSVGSYYNGAAYADAVGNDAYQTVTVTFQASTGTGGISFLSQTASNTFRIDNVTVSGYGVGADDWFVRGDTDVFQVSDTQVRTGSWALAWKPGSGTAGNDSLYLPIRTTPGQDVTGSIWVYHTEGSDQTFRLVLRIPGVNPNTQNVASASFEVPTATWTQLTASGTATTATTELEVRFDETGVPTNTFYLDDAEFYTGQAPANLGTILGDLHPDVSSNHTAESNDFDVDQLSWLKLDFDDTNDSNGDAWDQTLAISIPALLTFGQLMDRVSRFGYEWRIVPNPDFPATDTESHLLQVTNPWNPSTYAGGLGSDKTSTVTITAGQAVLAGPVKRSELSRTVALAMDDAGNLAVSRDATGETNWGQRFAGARERHIYDDSLQQVADQIITDRAQPVTASQVELIQTTQKPYLDFEPGDTITFGLPPDLSQGAHRVATFIYDVIDADVMWKVDFDRAVYSGLAGTVQAVNQLLRRASDPERTAEVVATGETGAGVDGPIEVTYLVAASDARAEIREQADFKCSGSADQTEINAAIDALPANGGRIVLSEGTFDITGDITVDAYTTLEGVGYATVLEVSTGTNALDLQGSNLITDLRVDMSNVTSCGAVYGIYMTGGPNIVSRVWFTGASSAARAVTYIETDGGSDSIIADCQFRDLASAAHYGISASSYLTVDGCSFDGQTGSNAAVAYGLDAYGSHIAVANCVFNEVLVEASGNYVSIGSSAFRAGFSFSHNRILIVSGDEIAVSGCNFTGSYDASPYIDVQGSAVTGVTISGNTMIGGGISLGDQSRSTAGDRYRILITGNLITGQSSGGNVFIDFIGSTTNHDLDDIVISGNHMGGVGEMAIDFSGTALEVRNLHITGNNIESLASGASKSFTVRVQTPQNTEDSGLPIVIEGNVLRAMNSDHTAHALIVAGSTTTNRGQVIVRNNVFGNQVDIASIQDVTFSDNTHPLVSEGSTQQGQYTGQVTIENVRNAVVRNNVWVGGEDTADGSGKSALWYIQATDSATVAGNDFWGQNGSTWTVGMDLRGPVRLAGNVYHGVHPTGGGSAFTTPIKVTNSTGAGAAILEQNFANVDMSAASTWLYASAAYTVTS